MKDEKNNVFGKREEKTLLKMAKRLNAIGLNKCPNLEQMAEAVISKIDALEKRIEKLEKNK